MVLDFLARHRTALASHVQRAFPQAFRTDRATRMHLQTLVAHGDLARRRDGAARPNVYLLTQRGLRSLQRLCGDGLATDPPSRRRPSGSHLVHELLVTEVAVALAEAVRERPDLAVPWEERFGFHRSAAFRALVPDYGFVLRHAEGLLACFVEVFSGEESPVRMGEKLQNYSGWAGTAEAQAFLVDLYRQFGAREPRPQFRLLIVAHDRRSGNDRARLGQLLLESLALPRAMRERVWVTTVAELRAASSLDDPVWVRARDLQDAHAEWETLALRARRRWLRRVAPSLARHRLFPSRQDPRHAFAPKHQSDRMEHPPRSERSARVRLPAAP